MVIAKYTGKIGLIYIKHQILAANIKKANRNATIIVATGIVAIIFLLIIGVSIWMALL